MDDNDQLHNLLAMLKQVQNLNYSVLFNSMYVSFETICKHLDIRYQDVTQFVRMLEKRRFDNSTVNLEYDSKSTKKERESVD